MLAHNSTGKALSKTIGRHGLMLGFSMRSYCSSSCPTPNLAAYKRGRGGRCSFNGVVATVFGATGFLGRSVCNRLGMAGTQMIIPYRSDFYDAKRLKVCGDRGQVLFIPYHIRNEESIAKAVQYSNVVINLVGRDYETKNFKYMDVHCHAARRLARISHMMGVDRFIHISYLNQERDPTPLVLSAPSMYKVSKFYGECSVWEEFPTATVFRCSDIYGQEDRFLRTFASNWRCHGNLVPLYGNGLKTIKQPVYVADVARGICKAIDDPDTKCKIYQAIGPKRYVLADLVDWIFALMRKNAPQYNYKRYDLAKDSFMGLKIALNNVVSFGYPWGGLHWEALEKESTTDMPMCGLPTLEDLGVQLTPMEHQVPWEMKPRRAFQYYDDKIGEFPDPPPPKLAYA